MGSSYNPAIVTDGLVLCLDAANQRSYPKSGTTWSDLAGANNGVMYNMSASNFDESNGGGLVFDGTDEYVQINQTLSTPFSICSFVKYSGPTKNYNTLINTNPHQVLGISLNRLSGGELNVYIGNGSSWTGSPGIALGSNTMLIDQVYQVTFTSTGSGSVLYLNGVQVATTYHSPSGWGSYYYLGRIGVASGEYLRGTIYNTMIYNKSLTGDEVRQNYEATAGRFS
jgi:hypothetical protein